MDALALAVRLLIGGILIASAVPKLLAPLRFQQIVLRYRILPSAWARPFSRALPWAEVGLAALLLTGVLTEIVAWLTVALMGSFAFALLVAGKAGAGEECGCMGSLWRGSRGWLILQDLALAAAAAFIAYEPAPGLGLAEFARHPEDRGAWLAVLLAALAAVASTLLGFMARWKPGADRTPQLLPEEGSSA